MSESFPQAVQFNMLFKIQFESKAVSSQESIYRKTIVIKKLLEDLKRNNLDNKSDFS